MSKVTTNVRKSYYALMLDEKTETYGEVKELCELIEMGVSPKEESSTLWAGGRMYDSVTALKDIEISLTIPEISTEQECEIFGKQKAESGGYVDNAHNKRPFIALFFEKELADGTLEYLTLYKCKLELAEDKAKTSEGKTDFQVKQFKAQAFTLRNGDWQYIVKESDEGFDSEMWNEKWGKEVIKATKKIVNQ